jgi:hypothetical protein
MADSKVVNNETTDRSREAYLKRRINREKGFVIHNNGFGNRCAFIAFLTSIMKTTQNDENNAMAVELEELLAQFGLTELASNVRGMPARGDAFSVLATLCGKSICVINDDCHRVGIFYPLQEKDMDEEMVHKLRNILSMLRSSTREALLCKDYVFQAIVLIWSKDTHFVGTMVNDTTVCRSILQDVMTYCAEERSVETVKEDTSMRAKADEQLAMDDAMAASLSEHVQSRVNVVMKHFSDLRHEKSRERQVDDDCIEKSDRDTIRRVIEKSILEYNAATTPVPKVVANVPKVVANAPKVVTNAPKVVATPVPKVVANAPKVVATPVPINVVAAPTPVKVAAKFAVKKAVRALDANKFIETMPSGAVIDRTKPMSVKERLALLKGK